MPTIFVIFAKLFKTLRGVFLTRERKYLGVVASVAAQKNCMLIIVFENLMVYRDVEMERE